MVLINVLMLRMVVFSLCLHFHGLCVLFALDFGLQSTVTGKYHNRQLHQGSLAFTHKELFCHVLASGAIIHIDQQENKTHFNFNFSAL